MNILILSCGTRNKILQYFKKTLNGTGRVVATDMSPYAPALYEADRHYIVPRMTAPGYLDVILDICRKAGGSKRRTPTSWPGCWPKRASGCTCAAMTTGFIRWSRGRCGRCFSFRQGPNPVRPKAPTDER